MVAEEEGALVADFGGDQAAREAQGEPGLFGERELGATEEDVLLVEAVGDAVEPAALGEVADGDAGFAEGLDGLGGELDVAEEVDLAEFADADLLEEAVLFPDLKDFAALADAEALGIEVERFEFGAGGDDAADLGIVGGRLAGEFPVVEEGELSAGRGGLGAEEDGFIGEADAGEGAARALGGIGERGRDGGGAGGGPGGGDLSVGLGEDLRRERDADALFGLGVPEDALLAVVAVFTEDEGLDGDLGDIGGPGIEAGGGFPRTAALVIDGSDGAAGDFDEVHPGDDAPLLAGEGDGAGVADVVRGGVLGAGQGAGPGIDAGVLEFPFDGFGAFGEDGFHPFVIEEPGAIDEFVQHPGGKVVREGAGGKGGSREG